MTPNIFFLLYEMVKYIPIMKIKAEFKTKSLSLCTLHYRASSWCLWSPSKARIIWHRFCRNQEHSEGKIAGSVRSYRPGKFTCALGLGGLHGGPRPPWHLPSGRWSTGLETTGSAGVDRWSCLPTWGAAGIPEGEQWTLHQAVKVNQHAGFRDIWNKDNSSTCSGSVHVIFYRE